MCNLQCHGVQTDHVILWFVYYNYDVPVASVGVNN